MSARPWIVVDMAKEQFRCDRCGEVAGLGLPVSVDELRRRGKAFTRDHKDCKSAQRGEET